MADKSISQLSPGVAVTDTDLLPNVQVVGVGPVKTTAVQIKTYVNTDPNITGVIKAQLGSAAAPSYTFDGDLNTGWWSPAADTLAASTGGTERIRINSAGNLGLGVTPSAWGATARAFQASFASFFGRTDVPSLISLTSNAYWDGTDYRYLATSQTATEYFTFNGAHAWKTAGTGTAGGVISFTQAMTLNASGNLGIGTTSPATRTHIVGDETELRVQSNTSTNGYVRFINSSGSMSVGMSGGPTNTLLTYDRTNSQNVHEYLGGASGYHVWYTAGFERMRIINTGSVGIGVVAPLAKLHVATAGNNYIVSHNTAGSTSALLLGAESNKTNIYSWTTVAGSIGVPLTFTVGASESMRIDTNGNVGIGTTNPGSYRLNVNKGATGQIAQFTDGVANTFLIRTATSTLFVGEANNNPLAFVTNDTERMRITSTGIVSVGYATPPAWAGGTGFRALQVGTYAALWNQSNGAANIGFACYESAANTFAYTTGDAPTRYSQLAGAHAWFSAPSGVAGNPITFTQAMVLDASGNLGVGTTSPQARVDVNGASRISGTSTFTSGSGLEIQYSTGTNTSTVRSYDRTAAVHRNLITYALNHSFYIDDANEVLKVTSSKSVVVNNAAVATNATDGFLYVPGCAGTPTGVPTAFTGRVPIVVDTTNNKLYFYSGGAWRDAGP